MRESKKKRKLYCGVLPYVNTRKKRKQKKRSKSQAAWLKQSLIHAYKKKA
jgi:hypothetical protein